MPYYAWQGVNIFGDFKKGKTFARSPEDLDKKIFSINIAIIKYKKLYIQKNGIFGLYSKISQDEKIEFFKQLAVLTSSGIMLKDALSIICDQTKNISFKQAIFEIESQIEAGSNFNDCLAKRPDIFDEISIQIAKIGQETGSFGPSLEKLSNYLQERNNFYKKIKSALTLPAITFSFFLIIIFGIFKFIVPRFEEIFKSTGKQLPEITKIVFSFSHFLDSTLFLYLIIACIITFFAIKNFRSQKNNSKVFSKNKLNKTGKIKKFYDLICVNTPYFGEIYIQTFLVNFLGAISILLKNGVRLVPSIEIAKGSVKNSVINKKIENLELDVYSGSSFSQAMIDYGDKFFPQELIAVVKIGEETATLELMLDRASQMYWQKVSRAFLFFTTIFQPLIMIVLGLLITLLVFAIYLPIFGLASVV